ncbi:MAG: GNAT family N-acetyltransferase [Planctomycetaceae bacterium]
MYFVYAIDMGLRWVRSPVYCSPCFWSANSVKVVKVLPGSSFLVDVKGLWRKNSDTLGMMPDGGFDDHAERKRILGLVDASGLQGYLMYRVSRNRANIVHLCVAESCRGKGASRLLIDELIKSTKHLNGIELRCRRDFAVSALWPKLGFVPIGERRGRALAGSTLTVWAMDYGKPTLLTRRSQSRALEVVIDANVLIDLLIGGIPNHSGLRRLAAG